ncbi:MAG: Asp-tRNA(Asn)/Glu-tRNA(Gln) amidotransferase subunit GatA [Pseudomonadales bacterium]|nr:Asp-tRNA(Asn)/Glu-tRNA(Gln) amidotransferase subunit GatA [Pseudomonadales bacterium]
MESFPSISALRAGLESGAFSSVELTRTLIDRIRRHNPVLNAFITLDEAGALEQAADADTRRREGTAAALCGIPIAHKDIFCTQGLPTTCASKMLADFIAPYDATVVSRLRAAGTILLGKTNMDEYAMGSSNENSHFGPVANPWNPAHVPGGSSGGSASAVAAGLVPIATGTDTGGSIRQPAAFCGLTGLKPTYGRVSRHGMVAFASSLDQGGLLAHSAQDIAQLLPHMCGFDPLDSTSSERDEAWLHDGRGLALDGAGISGRKLRIGLPREYLQALGVPAESFRAAIGEFEKAGFRVNDISLPHTPAAIPAYYVISGAEASTNLSRYDGVRFGHRCENPTSLEDLYRRSRSEGFGAEVKRRILTGTYALSVGYFDAYYLKAQRIRRLIQQDFLSAFESVDLILAPTTPDIAFRKGELSGDPVAMYQQDIFTIPASLAGLPAMSLPCGSHQGMPLGMQLIGPHFAEQTMLEAAALYQRATDWHLRHPEGWS